ncbi:class I SAM-dependent methyltransferase [Streptomyces actuosus]|uniref:Class I SAM-dependent methyltransferase n=1 Tax=Streptomyces actuosus TaxID=1885 RepID=A0ABS2VZW8_STRAS|nr:class I SAM-dependent methyltransferase [Streptomyces actuosus]MBN0048702.1 class I SAM-dependent methyltransferase [Streptomyces actuosus]
MGRVYDDERRAGAYERGNEMPESSVRAWEELIGTYLRSSNPWIVEIGAGTGMFSAAMAHWLDVTEVLAADASEPMLAEARRHHPHPAVRYVSGAADAVPAAAGTFDLAFLSRVIHHRSSPSGHGRPRRAACSSCTGNGALLRRRRALLSGA